MLAGVTRRRSLRFAGALARPTLKHFPGTLIITQRSFATKKEKEEAKKEKDKSDTIAAAASSAPAETPASTTRTQTFSTTTEPGIVSMPPLTDAQESAIKMCVAAYRGDIESMARLLEKKTGINSLDYDGRTPLHLAAASGNIKAVEFILQHGGDPGQTDRFGNTPLDDAERGAGRSFRSVAKILREVGGESRSAGTVFSSIELRTALHESLPMICERWQIPYCETWIPSKDGEEFMVGEVYAMSQHDTRFQTLMTDARHVQFKKMGGPLAKAYMDGATTCFQCSDANVGKHVESAKACGAARGIVVPLTDDAGTVVALLQGFFLGDDFSSSLMDDNNKLQVEQFGNRIVRAALFGNKKTPIFDCPPDIPEGQMEEVYNMLVEENVFSSALIYHEVDWFYHMGLQNFYFHRFDASTLACHIHSYIAAKKFATTLSTPDNIWLHIENNAKLLGGGGPEQALFMIPHEHRKIVAAERKLVHRIKMIPFDRPYNLEFFLASEGIVPGAKSKRLALYVLQTTTYANPSTLNTTERNIWEVASEQFLAEKNKHIRERYQEIINEAMDRLSPYARQFPTLPNGTVPVMFAFSRKSGVSADYLLHLTELLKQHDLRVSRKFIETFSNGIIVYSVYLENAAENRVEKLLQSFGMLHLVPTTSLTNKFLMGEYGAEQYTYLDAASRMVYYFINQRYEDFDSLAEELKDNPINLGRLRNLAQSLKREVISMDRIRSAFESNSQMVSLLFEDFKIRISNQVPSTEFQDKLNDALKRHDGLSGQIFQTVLTFNQHVLKTNLYKKRKSALAFRMDPSFLKAMPHEYPKVPYGFFFIMSSDFMGFHVRFQDIARGGIRILKSRDMSDFDQKSSTLFAENYGLAFTQNKKNKDIPEFGSKGVLAVHPQAHSTKFAFQKYISGLTDLMIPHDELRDKYGKPELLFLGPDEGTADFMEWACKYSRDKGYPFWRSFTTGKPLSMGGIPHDIYGMTTRSVRQYKINSYKKLGMKEEDIVKVQTGGPDGDLGSNEILLSKDKTKVIIDGSGVVYDPDGLDRSELERLARARTMIGGSKTVPGFDKKKLSKMGFMVLTEETDLTLPHGEKVRSGMVFRNKFHLHPLCTADIFVPCGGRPESITLRNVNQLFDKGVPRWKIVVEGANLFLTQDARMVLEEAGVVLFKDASTNKGGVTSSSLEVLAALSLSDKDFEKHMQVIPGKNEPQFYNDYVKDIQDRIASDADLEFECLWREHERTGELRYRLTDMVSDKINTLNLVIQESPLYKNDLLRNNVLKRAVPPSLLRKVPLAEITQRVPEPYLRSVFCAYLASRFVYKFGLDANEFSFFQFVDPLLKAD